METLYIIAVSTVTGFCTGCALLGLACLLDMSGLTTITRGVVRPLYTNGRSTEPDHGPATRTVQLETASDELKAEEHEPERAEEHEPERMAVNAARPFPEEARAALMALYEGTTLNREAAKMLFEQGTTNDVRQRLGYADGKDWFDNAPIGLLFAEHQVAADKATIENQYFGRKNVSEQYAALAVGFERHDLVALLMFDMSGQTVDVLPLDPVHVFRGPGTLPESLFNVVVQKATPKALNFATRHGDRPTTLWRPLILGLDVPEQRIHDALNRLVDAGAEYVASLDEGERKGLTRHVLKAAKEREKVVEANRGQRELLAKANAYTPMEAERLALQAVVEDVVVTTGQALPKAGSRRRL